MIWSNWQKAIGRGAALTLLFWAGLAWTQTPAQPSPDRSERIMVVHQQGKSTRCRVLETWQLPDKRVAHLLQAIETPEFITIVDDHAPPATKEGDAPARGMPKRIFAWGPGCTTPPEGAPLPPRRSNPDLTIKNDAPSASDAAAIPSIPPQTGQEISPTVLPSAPAVSDPNHLILHEKDKSTRCRVLETWQLPDKRVAQLLQAVETSEFITIVDTHAAPASKEGEVAPRGMPKRIFAWGVGRTTPPEGSPMPPQHGNAGLTIMNEQPSAPSVPVVIEQNHVILHEKDKTTRCRVLDTWQLPDQRVAHLLRAVETSEFITIVDEQVPAAHGDGGPAHSMLKRIYGWGVGRTAPPEGSPLPPQRSYADLAIQSPQNLAFGSQPHKPGQFDPQSAGSSSCVDSAPCCGPVAQQRLSAFPRLQALLMKFGPEKTPAPVPGNQAIDMANSVTPGRLPFGGTFNQGTTSGNPLVVSGMDQQPKTMVAQPRPNSFEQAQFAAPLAPALEPGTQRDPTAIGPGTAVKVNPTSKWPYSGVFGTGTRPSPQPDPAAFAQHATAGSPFTPSVGAPVQVAPASGPNSTSPWQYSGVIGTGTRPSPQPDASAFAQAPPPPRFLGSPQRVTPASMPNVGPFTPPIPATLAIPIDNPPLQVATPAQMIEPAPPQMAATVPPSPPQMAATVPQAAPQPPANVEPKKSWHPGDKLQAWLKGMSAAPKTPDAKPADSAWKAPAKSSDQRTDELLNQQNKIAQKQIEQRVEQLYKVPFSTAMSTTPLPNATKTDANKPESSNLAVPGREPEAKPAIAPPPGIVTSSGIAPTTTFTPPSGIAPPDTFKAAPLPTPTRDMWGQKPPAWVAPPGKSLLDPATKPTKPTEIVKLPAPSERRRDPLMEPDRITSVSANKPAVLPPSLPEPKAPVRAEETNGPPPFTEPSWPLNSQSVLASRSGLQGPVVYVPVPMVTQPYPNHPPTPPPPVLPSAPELNLYVNAFSPQPTPKGATVAGGQAPPMMGAFANPGQQMMYQQMMQQQMMQQQMMQQQMQQQTMGYGNPMLPYMTPSNPMMAQGTPYRPQMPSTGPMNNFSRNYAGPLPPNPTALVNYNPMASPPMQYGTMPQQQPLQQMSYQQPMPGSPAQQLEVLLRVLRESPYPVQREWAAQSLASYDWRANPQIVPALVQSANQDPVGTVRARSVWCLGRIGAAIEPVFNTLQTLRNDIDPRVCQEVERAFVALSQMPMMPR